MWIICGGMIRSASTLQFQIVKELVERTNTGKSLGWVEDNNIKQVIEENKDYDGFLVIKTHTYLAAFDEIKDKKIVYTYRDLRDVCSSLIKKEKKTFYRLCGKYRIKKLVKLDEFWRALDDILISDYNSLRFSLGKEIRRIADFLGLDVSDELLLEIEKNLSFENQKKKLDKIDETRAFKHSGNLVDKETLLHSNHINSVDSGIYKQTLKIRERAFIEFYARKWFLKYNFKLDFPYVVAMFLALYERIINKIKRRK